MWLKLSLVVFFLVKNITTVSSFCEKLNIIICDDLTDITHSKISSKMPIWKHVQIGTHSDSEFRSDGPPSYVVNRTLFLYLPRIKSLTIINQIRYLKGPFFLKFQDKLLEYLNLYDNNIIEINDFTFGNPGDKLKEVYLEKNNIQHLGRGVFQEANLDVVDLSRNQITSITTCFLSSKIKWILLNHNKISFISPRAFPNNLEQLELNDNLIEILENDVFENIKYLKELFIEKNRLTTVPGCISPLKKIQYLHFAYNLIEEVSYPFNQHQELQYIDFTANRIRKVEAEVFTVVDSNPMMVLLSLNRLTNINFKDSKTQKKMDIFFYGNPLNCDCLHEMEKTLLNYNSCSTCSIEYFNNGKLPLCIDSGRCDENVDISTSDIDRFLNQIGTACEKSLVDCLFRL